LIQDFYIQAQKQVECKQLIKGSKFLGFLYPVGGEYEAKEKLAELKKTFPDATHHCYAYVLGKHSEHEKWSDDGEPSNSAGRPILRAIHAAQCTNVLVVVVRYYGGKQLGVPGLIEAYGSTAQSLLGIVPLEQVPIVLDYVIQCDFAHEKDAWHFIRQQKLQSKQIEYTHTNCHIKVQVPIHQEQDFLKYLSTFYMLGVDKED
jgi:uncharacterized YigZ family protein